MLAGEAPQPVPVRRTVALAFTGAGRATRSELVSYALAAAFTMLLVSFVTALVADYPVRALVSNGLTLILAIPVPALLVRRLHDQGRGGWAVWLALPGFTVWLVRTGIALSQGMQARIELDRMTWAVDWIVILANVALVLLLALPGTAGPNRFGPDPRRSPA
ncbi:MAG: DUF805 domain-containing protein [Sphingomonadaceae bacterium]|nr:DUF805 domain-containing protein [Sphingomonadaceae bacterium]